MVRRHQRHEGATLRDGYDTELLAKGFAMVATRGDCGIFGQWANPLTRTIVTYVEGDVMTTECDTDAELVRELERIRDWHENEQRDWVGVDTSRTAVAEAFARAGAAHLMAGAGKGARAAVPAA